VPAMCWAGVDLMAEEEEQTRCTKCGGLGAVVIQYPAVDSEGYHFVAQAQQTCDNCGGTGWV
jgi:DnaJ-class molecular chaperone